MLTLETMPEIESMADEVEAVMRQYRPGRLRTLACGRLASRIWMQI
jgi:hypothetical protein